MPSQIKATVFMTSEVVQMAGDQSTMLATLNLGAKMVPMIGVRCPNCAAKGEEVWVIPGRACANCGTHC